MHFTDVELSAEDSQLALSRVELKLVLFSANVQFRRHILRGALNQQLALQSGISA